MNVVGFAGYSGSGKTTLVEKLIPALKLRGLRVSVVKHAHHKFDIDHPGKDTFRHREAGAFEVVVASHNGVDWVLVEGFKHSDLPKIEVWRAASSKPVRYVNDDFVVAIATDSPGQLPEATLRPVLDLNDAEAVADFLLNNQERFVYSFEDRPG